MLRQRSLSYWLPACDKSEWANAGATGSFMALRLGICRRYTRDQPVEAGVRLSQE